MHKGVSLLLVAFVWCAVFTHVICGVVNDEEQGSLLSLSEKGHEAEDFEKGDSALVHHVEKRHSGRRRFYSHPDESDDDEGIDNGGGGGGHGNGHGSDDDQVDGHGRAVAEPRYRLGFRGCANNKAYCLFNVDCCSGYCDWRYRELGSYVCGYE